MLLKSMFDPVIDRLRFMAVLIAVLFLVSGCAALSQYIDPAREYAGKGAAVAIEGECQLSNKQRLQNLVSVNAALAERGAKAKALSLDCDGDGQPDLLEVQ